MSSVFAGIGRGVGRQEEAEPRDGDDNIGRTSSRRCAGACRCVSTISLMWQERMPSHEYVRKHDALGMIIIHAVRLWLWVTDVGVCNDGWRSLCLCFVEMSPQGCRSWGFAVQTDRRFRSVCHAFSFHAADNLDM